MLQYQCLVREYYFVSAVELIFSTGVFFWWIVLGVTSPAKFASSHSEFPSESTSRNFDFWYQKSCSEFKMALTFAYELGIFSVIHENLSARDFECDGNNLRSFSQIFGFSKFQSEI